MDVEQDRQFIGLAFRQIAIDADADVTIRRMAEMGEGVPFGFHVSVLFWCVGGVLAVECNDGIPAVECNDGVPAVEYHILRC